MHVWYRQFWMLRVSVTSFYVIRRYAYTVSGGSVNPPCSCRARRLDLTVDIGLLENAKFHGGFKKWIPFSHLSQIDLLYELEKKSSLVTRALSAKSCTRDTDSLHSCTRLRLVQEMACLYHECKILPRKHSYPNLIPILYMHRIRDKYFRSLLDSALLFLSRSSIKVTDVLSQTCVWYWRVSTSKFEDDAMARFCSTIYQSHVDDSFVFVFVFFFGGGGCFVLFCFVLFCFVLFFLGGGGGLGGSFFYGNHFVIDIELYIYRRNTFMYSQSIIITWSFYLNLVRWIKIGQGEFQDTFCLLGFCFSVSYCDNIARNMTSRSRRESICAHSHAGL